MNLFGLGSIGGSVPQEHDHRGFVILRVGECSFCGQQDEQIFAYACIPGRAAIICAQCLHVYLRSGRKHEADARRRKEMAARIYRLDPMYEAKERLGKGMRSGNIDEMVEAAQQMVGREMHPEEVRDVRDLLERLERGQSSCRIGPRPIGPRPIDLEACSFCDATRGEIHKLRSTPRAAICDGCMYGAGVALLNAFWRPGPGQD